MNHPLYSKLEKAYNRVIQANDLEPRSEGFCIADATILADTDYAEPIKSLAEAHDEAIYFTPRLCDMVQKHAKDPEAQFAFFIGHEFYHYFANQPLDHKPIRAYPMIEQKADLFGVGAARNAGYEPKAILTFPFKRERISLLRAFAKNTYKKQE